MASNILSKLLQGKVAIVTGGASGIGEATARAFIKHAARAVVIADIQEQKGRSVAESIGLHRCSYVNCDVSDEEQVKSMVDYTAASYGGVDIMFSSAGINSSSGVQNVLDLDLTEFDSVMRVNARGMAVCVKQAARKMVEMGTIGAIICTASSAVGKNSGVHADYVMSKEAVVGLMRSASVDLGKHGIRVNSVSPGMVFTPLAEKVGLKTAAEVEAVVEPVTSLKGVALTAEQVAEAVVFLASDMSGFVTGQNLMVDGGMICLPIH